MLPWVNASVGCITPSIVKTFLVESLGFSTALTFNTTYFESGVTTLVPSNNIESPSVKSKSCSSSNSIPSVIVGSLSTVPSSKSIPSWNVPVCSCSTLITFSNVVF